MTHQDEKPHQQYSKMNALSLDSPNLFEEQRSRMQSVALSYLRQKALECIENRRAPSQLYINYSYPQATEAVTLESKAARFVPNGSSPARRSELAARIVTQRNYLVHRREPLKCSGAFSLQPLSQTSPHVSSKSEGKACLPFDTERFDEIDAVFINGELQVVSKAHPNQRLFYGLDSPTAVIQSAAAAAAANHVGKSDAALSSGGVQKDTHRSQHQVTPASLAAERNRRIPRRDGTPKEQYTRTSASPDRYRDYLSPSGRHYRVFRLHKQRLPPIEESQNPESFSLHARGASEAGKAKAAGDRKSFESFGDISVRCHPKEERIAAHQRDSGRGSVKNEKLLLAVRKSRTKKPHKPRSAAEKLRGARDGDRRPNGTSHQNRGVTQRTCRRCRRSLSPTPRAKNAPYESSGLFSPSPSTNLLDDIVDSRTGGHVRGGTLGGSECRRCSHVHRDVSHGQRAEHRLPPVRQVRGRHPAPAPPPYPHNHARDEHMRRRQRDYDEWRDRKRRARRSEVLSNSSELSSPLSDSFRLWPSVSSSIEGASDTSDCVVMDELQRSTPGKHRQRGRAARRVRARSSSPLVSAGDDADSELSDRKGGYLCDRCSEWDDKDSTSSLPSFVSLSSSELSSTSASGAEVRRPRGRDSHRRHCRSTHSPPCAQCKRRRPGARDSASTRRERRVRGKMQSTRNPASSFSLTSSSDDSGAGGRHCDSPARSRAAHATKSGSGSSTCPPIVRAVDPTHPLGMLPPLVEEVLPSTRYAASAATPLAQKPQSTQKAEANHRCTSPTVPSPRTHLDTVGREVDQSHDTVGPTRRASQQMPMSPLQVARFRDLTTVSDISSGPVCASPAQQFHQSGRVTPSPATEPLDLQCITEHVLRVIQDRLTGIDSMRETESLCSRCARDNERDAAIALREREVSERQRALQVEAEEAVMRGAEQARLRDLLLEAQQEVFRVRAEHLSLSSLTDSLRFALEQVTRLMECGDGAADHTSSPGIVHPTVVEQGNSSTKAGVSKSNTFVYCATVNDTVTAPRAGAGPASGGSVGDTAAAVNLDHKAFLPGSALDAATLQRLIAVLRRRRQRHEIELHHQRRRAEEVEEERVRKAAQLEVAELVASERQARGSVQRAEEEARDEVLVIRASTLDEAIDRMVVSQRRARMSGCEEELDERTRIIAAEEEEAARLWDVAAGLWEAAAEEAEAHEEENRQRLEKEAAAAAAWQEEQNAEVERLQSEARRMEAEAAAAQMGKERGEGSWCSTGSAHQSATDEENIVMSHLIPGQLLGITGARSIEHGGKIRLVGNPHIAAVEAHARERRRTDRLRQQRLLSALPSLPRTNKASDPSGSRLLSRQPSTVRMGFRGSLGGPKSRSRASSRNFPASSFQFSSDESGALGERSRSQSRLPSRSNFVCDSDVDLHVYGRQVGIAPRIRTRSSSPASARGFPMKADAEIITTPNKKGLCERMLVMGSMRASQPEH
ncbi:hypothetical protein GH5_06658 [Leishmania sp. Ghana 2012 LV757]|uniref:hypothetical protein n=1 Tax=Leishmania sp. Ghana 2012 LV757 TaxID=2803181 RepID=UPI001B43E0BF|nr:hypothetical protein GH5_06658 [Leishmania sp. Ghana 2012 LV757]